ncbi:isochorismatase family protein [Rhodovulum sulfidophilum]|uniref:isochorismatase family protein n=1 Tax=Rhodovulum sulfidophilum TaxID=35806 RepID=UPI001F38777A|nr:isochorismatase family protein [Rhodovulum sulfidophilum]MCE8431586.1 isochorismatase family protein [Rhodovulum sulfidophilum]MCF4118894.1 isochorismatase family protein [Rhodovulum sulfidophilum]
MKALVIIDMQIEMQHRIEAGRDCVNADAPIRIATLAGAFRQQGLPVIHVRHRDGNPKSPLHADSVGYSPMPCAEAIEGEAVFVKQTSSVFASTDLAAHLQNEGITELVVTGAVAGFCVNSTVRSGADLGFNMTVVRDAVIGFDLPAAGQTAQVIFDVTMAHLEADFALLVDASAVMAE